MRRDEIMIRYRTERGLSTLIMVIGAFLLTRSWWAGDLSQWIGLLFNSMRGDDMQFGMKSQDGMMSISYAVVSIIGDVFYGIFLAVTWFATDVRNGFRMWWDSRFPQVEPAVESVVDQPEATTNAVTLADVLGNIQDGLVSLQSQIDEMQAAPKAAPKTTRTRKATNATV
jgi:hypothetical protein